MFHVQVYLKIKHFRQWLCNHVLLGAKLRRYPADTTRTRASNIDIDSVFRHSGLSLYSKNISYSANLHTYWPADLSSLQEFHSDIYTLSGVAIYIFEDPNPSQSRPIIWDSVRLHPMSYSLAVMYWKVFCVNLRSSSPHLIHLATHIYLPYTKNSGFNPGIQPYL